MYPLREEGDFVLDHVDGKAHYCQDEEQNQYDDGNDIVALHHLAVVLGVVLAEFKDDRV